MGPFESQGATWDPDFALSSWTPGLWVRTPLWWLGSASDAVGPGRNPSLTKPSPPLSLPNNLHTQKSALGVPAGFSSRSL